MKYRAFLSYSHRDAAIADWFFRKLEAYRTPRALVGTASRDGTVPARLAPLFRDREELPTASNLGAVIQDALEQSHYLVVLCSPHSAASRYVNEEILSYKRMGRSDHILAIIIAGEPNASEATSGFDPDQECFPPALRYALGPDGELSTLRQEPIAADARPGKDGRSRALLKTVAGLLGVGFDDLYQREARRQRSRRLLAGAAALLVATSGFLIWQRFGVEQEKATQASAQADQARIRTDLESANSLLQRNEPIEALRLLVDVADSGLGQESADDRRRLTSLLNRALAVATPVAFNLELPFEAERIVPLDQGGVLVWSDELGRVAAFRADGQPMADFTLPGPNGIVSQRWFADAGQSSVTAIRLERDFEANQCQLNRFQVAIAGGAVTRSDPAPFDCELGLSLVDADWYPSPLLADRARSADGRQVLLSTYEGIAQFDLHDGSVAVRGMAGENHRPFYAGAHSVMVLESQRATLLDATEFADGPLTTVDLPSTFCANGQVLSLEDSRRAPRNHRIHLDPVDARLVVSLTGLDAQGQEDDSLCLLNIDLKTRQAGQLVSLRRPDDQPLAEDALERLGNLQPPVLVADGASLIYTDLDSADLADGDSGLLLRISDYQVGTESGAQLDTSGRVSAVAFGTAEQAIWLIDQGTRLRKLQLPRPPQAIDVGHEIDGVQRGRGSFAVTGYDDSGLRLTLLTAEPDALATALMTRIDLGSRPIDVLWHDGPGLWSVSSRLEDAVDLKLIRAADPGNPVVADLYAVNEFGLVDDTPQQPVPLGRSLLVPVAEGYDIYDTQLQRAHCPTPDVQVVAAASLGGDRALLGVIQPAAAERWGAELRIIESAARPCLTRTLQRWESATLVSMQLRESPAGVIVHASGHEVQPEWTWVDRSESLSTLTVTGELDLDAQILPNQDGSSFAVVSPYARQLQWLRPGLADGGSANTALAVDISAFSVRLGRDDRYLYDHDSLQWLVDDSRCTNVSDASEVSLSPNGALLAIRDFDSIRVLDMDSCTESYRTDSSAATTVLIDDDGSLVWSEASSLYASQLFQPLEATLPAARAIVAANRPGTSEAP